MRILKEDETTLCGKKCCAQTTILAKSVVRKQQNYLC